MHFQQFSHLYVFVCEHAQRKLSQHARARPEAEHLQRDGDL
jgi:hypothetical protein